MSASKNEETARSILGDWVQEDDGLNSLSPWLDWHAGDDTVGIDGGFTLPEMEAIAWWMRNKGGKQRER